MGLRGRETGVEVCAATSSSRRVEEMVKNLGGFWTGWCFFGKHNRGVEDHTMQE